MKKKYNEATRNRPEGDRVLDAPLVTIDLPEFIDQIKNEPAWNKNDRNAITVFKTDTLRLVLAAFHEGAEMEHLNEATMCLHVLKGKLRCTANNETFDLKKQQIITLHPGVAYNIVAKKETTFLLIMTGNSILQTFSDRII